MGVDPLTIGLAIASAASSVAGSMAQRKQADYQAAVAKQNQRIALMNATNARRAGVAKEQSEVWKVRGLLGQQRAAQAASGLDVGSESSALVRETTAKLGNLGFGNIRDNTLRQEYQHLGEATQYGNEAALAKASKPTMFTTFLSAASAAGGTLAKSGVNLFGGGTKTPQQGASLGGLTPENLARTSTADWDPYPAWLKGGGISHWY